MVPWLLQFLAQEIRLILISEKNDCFIIITVYSYIF